MNTAAEFVARFATDADAHLARRVAQAPAHASVLLRRWWRARVITIAVALLALWGGLWISGVDGAVATPLLLFAIVYAATSLVDLLNYFYRGLSRSDIESTLTIGQRQRRCWCTHAMTIPNNPLTICETHH